MTIGIYAIVNKINGEMYIGKSRDIEKRWQQHLSLLRLNYKHRDCNRHLYNAFRKYGEDNFGFEYIEVIDVLDDDLLSSLELKYMIEYDSVSKGYNLRMDTKTKCIVQDSTRELISKLNAGERNPNYGNSWSDEAKKSMSETKKKQHADGVLYSEEWKQKQGEASKERWSKMNDNQRNRVGELVSKAKTTYRIGQYTKDGKLIKEWDCMRDILVENPDYFRIAIYNNINGHKKSYRGFVWKKLSMI